MKKLRIRDLREDKDLKQSDIANILGLSQSQYSRIETGECELSYDGLIKLSQFYNTNIEYILGISNIMTPIPLNNKK